MADDYSLDAVASAFHSFHLYSQTLLLEVEATDVQLLLSSTSRTDIIMFLKYRKAIFAVL